ncbi:MAG: hypothetical protein NT147_08895 [Candidatus Aminicenantes bacterium]|nr:hypothetical protein [Candidatus Aminicenantes bacterium]
MTAPRILFALGIVTLGFAALAPGGFAPQDQAPAAGGPDVKRITVPADAGWVDTGIDVGPGEELVFRASGEVSVQRGNPDAGCGPGGLDMITVEQPVPDQNLGALIGRVAQLVSTRTDEDSGMEIRDEIFVLFYIGPERTVIVPVKGRLYLGLNENALKDNAGEFTVLVVRSPA